MISRFSVLVFLLVSLSALKAVESRLKYGNQRSSSAKTSKPRSFGQAIGERARLLFDVNEKGAPKAENPHFLRETSAQRAEKRTTADKESTPKSRSARRSPRDSNRRRSNKIHDRLYRKEENIFIKYIIGQEENADSSEEKDTLHVNSNNDDIFFSDDVIANNPDFFCYRPSESAIAFSQSAGNFTCSTSSYDPPPPCISDLDGYVVDENGEFSVVETFYNCIQNVEDSPLPAHFYDGYFHGCLRIYTIMTVLNLVQIDEIAGSVTLQVSMEYIWKDRRYVIEEFNDYTFFSYTGFDLTEIVRSNEDIVFWTPEITFLDAESVEVLSESLSMDKNNFFHWVVSYNLVLVQPLFNFQKYPNDEQQLDIRLAISNYDSFDIELQPLAIICSFLEDNTCSFSHNPIWTWNEELDYCTWYVDRKTSGGYIWPTTTLFRLTMTRQGEGVVVRLVLPIMFLLLLSALTFWISYESRVDTTITLLLSVSALYIVILGNIPMVGYLTNVDLFVFWMFLLLVVVCTLHQVYATLFEKVDRFPLRIVYMRLIELVGRTTVVPFILFYFLSTIYAKDNSRSRSFMGLIAAMTAVLLTRELFGVRSAVKEALAKLVEKVNYLDLEADELTIVETLVLNLWLFKRFTFSKEILAKELEARGKVENALRSKVQLKNLAKLRSFSGSMTSIDQSSVLGPPTESPLWKIKKRMLQRSLHEDASNEAFAVEMQQPPAPRPPFVSSVESSKGMNDEEDSDDEYQ